jgi:hypothetical protein
MRRKSIRISWKSLTGSRAERCAWSPRWHATVLPTLSPDRIDIAIPRGSRIPALRPAIDVHVFAKKTFELGREEVDITDGFAVGLYSAERSLVDVIRLRHREGADVAWEALRRWLRRRGAKPATLIEMAKRFHGAERAVRNAGGRAVKRATKERKNHACAPFPERERSTVAGVPKDRLVSAKAARSSFQELLSKSTARSQQVSSSRSG